MKPQLSPKLTMKTAHIWNSLANMHACIPWSLASSFYKWKKPPLYRAVRTPVVFHEVKTRIRLPHWPTDANMQKQHTYTALTPLNKIKLSRQKKKYCVSCQKLLAHEQIMPFTTTSPCGWVANETCPYIHQNVAFTEGGQKSTSYWPSFQNYLKDSLGLKAPIAL